MITFEAVQALIQEGESSRLEFKKSTNTLKKALETFCGMLNAEGGYILIGVSDDGKIVGQDTSDKTLREIQTELRKIEPNINIEPQKIPISASSTKVIIVLEAGPYDSKPFCYDGKPYIRHGNQTYTMNQQEYQKLLLDHAHAKKRWEILPTTLGLDDLDHEEIRLTLETAIQKGRLSDPFTRDSRTTLQGFGLLEAGKLTNAAVALFAKRERILPQYAQLKLQLARFKGNDKSEFIDSKQHFGNMFELLEKAQSFLLQHLPISGRIIPGVIERQDDPLYPLEALREALANAFCHRDYGDQAGYVSIALYNNRLEITSTGRLPFGLTPELLYQDHASKPWNPVIATILYKRGIIETWGRGTLLIKQKTEKAGFVTPSIIETNDSVKVTFFPERYECPSVVSHQLLERQESILNFLGRHSQREFPMRELKETLSTTYKGNERLLRTDLMFLKELKLVNLTGHGRGAKWQIVQPELQGLLDLGTS
ncbi:MAG: RNA-binding domain-containing protein [Vampirovibrionales bacterium]